MTAIVLTESQIDTIVVDDLKQSLEMQFDLDTDEGGEYLEPDYELINALKTVLKYYMPCNEVKVFLEKMSRKESAVQTMLSEGKMTDIL